MSILSVAFIGAGGIAQSHLRAISQLQQIEAVAVMDTNPQSLQATVTQYKLRPYDNLEAVLNDPQVEAVHVCTPHYLHADQVVTAAQAGKHVLVEKPMALSVADCDRMIAACEANDRLLMVGQVMRYYPINRRIKAMIVEGEIGQVGHLMRRRYSYFDPTAPNSSYRGWYLDPEQGGICVLYCFGPHEYDILPWYLDSPVIKVYAQGSESSDLYRGQKDSYTAMLTHQNGAISVLSQSLVCHHSEHDQYIVGQSGSLKLTANQLRHNGELVEVDGSSAEGMPNQIEEFANCCLHGGQPDASGHSVRHSMAVIEAAKLSAEREEPVMISEFD